ncbi:MAG: hypothetical protein HFH85_20810 [Lachnospiraceae bacterium]|jgi:hypothetical protein|nr:hypothetical protein [Lachnospiraceae bacterium]
MKSKNAYQIPDSYYNFFGIYVSGSNNQDDKVLFPESTGKFISKSDRIDTLVRESRYKSYFPVMKRTNLLSLNFPSMPLDSLQKIEYVKNVIRSSIKKSLMSLSHDRKIEANCLQYITDIFYLYRDSVSIKVLKHTDNIFAGLACEVFKCSEVISITFLKLDNLTVYAYPFNSRKIKYGYYHFRSNRSVEAHIIDLPELLSDVSVANSLFELLTGNSIPLVQDIFERCIANIKKYSDKSSDDEKILEFICSRAVLPYDRFFHFYHMQKSPVPYAGMTSRLSSGLYDLFCRLLDIFQDLSYENSYREQLTRNVATAYMTKKNIPETVLNAMKNTGFLHYFKYVEFDEDVDLLSVNAIEKEFIAMNKAYFSGSVFPDVKIRFRKLGKHRASGLYYPFLNTLCVDIRSPSSFIHEYFHMIDNQLGDLSLDLDFQDIVEEYKKAFLEALNKEDQSVKEKMHGKSKYNISYFFRRAEIFARCGEIYLVRILGVESSLLEPDLGYAYPESEVLDSIIQNYYQVLLKEKLACSVFAKAC